MGSFNVSCGLSGLPIQENDRAGFVVLAKSRYKVNERGAILTDACQNYSPMTAPVYGTYDSYGRIVNSETGFGATMIEKLFNRPADDVVEAISECRDIYDSHSKASEIYLINGAEYKEIYDTEETLMLLGYEKNTDGSFSYGETKLVLNDERIIAAYVKDALIPSHLLGNSYYAHNTVFNLARYTKDYPGVAAEDQAAVDLLSNSYGMFFSPEVFDGMKKFLKEDEFREYFENKFVEGWDVMQKQFAARALMEDKLDFHEEYGFISHAVSFNNDATEALKRGLGLPPEIHELFENAPREEVKDILNLVAVATHTARFIGPSMYVTEDCPWDATNALIKIMSDQAASKSRNLEY